MTPDQQKAVVRRLVTEAQQGGNLAVVDEILAPDFVDHTPLGGLPANREGVKIFFAALRQGLPDLEVEIRDQVAEANEVATRKAFKGTHQGPFLGVPASGRSIEFEVIDILRFHGDRITDHWVVVDRLDLMTQLGALAPA